MSQNTTKEPQFPMLDGPSIPLSLARVLYAGYSALNGTRQSLADLASRGGFGWEEVAPMYRNKRARAAIDAASRK